MIQPTHTRRELGGKYAELQQHEGAGPLQGQWLVIYEDLEQGIQSATTEQDWLTNWREIDPDDCTVCMGTGTDHIKGNAANPCGYCYGLGKMLKSGERPSEMWDVAGIAIAIIQRQLDELLRLRRIANNPAVQDLLAQQYKQLIDESTPRNKQSWKNDQSTGRHQ